MKWFYIFAVGMIVVVLGMLFYPTVHGIIMAVDRAGFLPLTSAGTTLLAYAFLGFVVYAIVQMFGKN